MNLFKRFEREKKQAEVVDQLAPIQEYPAIVHKIHNEFMSAGDELVKEANEILANCEIKDEDKVNRLAKLGFKQVKQVVDAEFKKKKAIKSKETLDKLRSYRMKYPLYRFITEDQVESICEKYGLVFSTIDRYTGFVPEKNVSDIEKFEKLHGKDFKDVWTLGDEVIDMSNYEVRREGRYAHIYHKKDDSVHHFQANIVNEEIGDWYASGIINGKYYDLTKSREVFAPATYRICAPIKDMDTKGLRLDGYKLKRIPDPVVLQPVKGGYLIVTAWGDEASDPEVVNQINN